MHWIQRHVITIETEEKEFVRRGYLFIMIPLTPGVAFKLLFTNRRHHHHLHLSHAGWCLQSAIIPSSFPATAVPDSGGGDCIKQWPNSQCTKKGEMRKLSLTVIAVFMVYSRRGRGRAIACGTFSLICYSVTASCSLLLFDLKILLHLLFSSLNSWPSSF